MISDVTYLSSHSPNPVTTQLNGHPQRPPDQDHETDQIRVREGQKPFKNTYDGNLHCKIIETSWKGDCRNGIRGWGCEWLCANRGSIKCAQWLGAEFWLG